MKSASFSSSLRMLTRDTCRERGVGYKYEESTLCKNHRNNMKGNVIHTYLVLPTWFVALVWFSRVMMTG